MDRTFRGIDVLFIFPPMSMDERYGRKVGDVGGHLPPLGITTLAGVVREKGFTVDLIDGPAMDLTLEDILEYVKETKPKAIGISSLTATFYRAIFLGEEVKKAFPDMPVIIGGHHATIISEPVMRENPCFDLLIYGEGELTLLEILEKLRKGDLLNNAKELGKIKGIYYRDGDKIVKTPPREPIQDLDSLPYPAWDLLPMDRYTPLPNQYKRKPLMNMVAIRGCPYNCTFCSNNAIFGRKIRAKSPERVVEEIKHLMDNYGIREVSFWDDTLTVNREWIMKLCGLIIDQKIDIVWSCYARVNTVDPELLKTMRKAGCWNIFYGFESGSQKLLNNIKKGITLDQIRQANQWTKDAGIEVRASFMLALPGETPELAQKTIDFAKELDPDYVQFCITTPYPGTGLFKTAEKYGKLDLNYSRYTIWEAVFIPHGYKNAEEILQMEKHAMRSFYFRPKYIVGRIRTIRSPSDIMKYIKGLRMTLGFT